MLSQDKEKLVLEIQKLKKERQGVILAHNYQIEEVQRIADFVGDSLELARTASRSDAKTIVFCGVHFMAETAAIINPEHTVLLPDMYAGCPLADMISAEKVREMKVKFPDAAVVCYVNTSAEVKAEADICCTSSNAAAVVNSLTAKRVIFAPDKNLGHYVSSFTKKEMILWEGYCTTHVRLTKQDVVKAKELYPQAVFIAHPECDPEVLALADYVCSTGGMFRRAKELGVKEIIVGTEYGMLYRLQRENLDKKFYIASSKLICPNMKKITLEKVRDSLRDLKYVVKVPENIRTRAYAAIYRMLQLG